MASAPLSQDIILLFCEEIAARHDFATLFRCSLVSRRVASIALEKLYSIQEFSRASAGDARYRFESRRLWRSIILSSIGQTIFPYCAYVRTLSLGNLEECLQDMSGNEHILDIFFRGEMAQFRAPREGGEFVDSLAVMVNCADSITKHVKEYAGETGSTFLARLEGTSMPTDKVTTWIARLGALTSLCIRDGSILDVDVAKTISKYCPKFADLTCYFHASSTADEDLAAFFHALPPSSLRSFAIICENEIGNNTLTALNAHGTSLRRLVLTNLRPRAVRALGLLSACTSLETLTIESERSLAEDMLSSDVGLLDAVSSWISSCKSLRSFTLSSRGLCLVTKNILEAPDLHLTSLSIVQFDSDEGEFDAAMAALSLQNNLQDLTLGLRGFQVVNLKAGLGSSLTGSICQLKDLTSLNLMQSFVSNDEVERIARALPKLSEFSFSGGYVNDSILRPLGSLPRLKTLAIHAISCFTWRALRGFAVRLDAEGNRGIKVDVLNQSWERSIAEDHRSWLQNYFSETLKGIFRLVYSTEPHTDDEITDQSD